MRDGFPSSSAAYGGGAAVRSLIGDLRGLQGIVVETDVDLRRLSRWRCGGRADLVVYPNSPAAMERLVRYLHRRCLRWAVTGEGSNLFFDDRGVRVPIIRIGPAMGAYSVSGQAIECQAGVWVPKLARIAGRNGLAGIEHIVGIPGTIGGLVVMNGGSLRQSLATSLRRIDVVTPDGSSGSLSPQVCAFGYRTSAFLSNGMIVVGARLALWPDDPAAIRRRMIEIIAARRRKFPKQFPNCGSVFVSDPAVTAKVGPPGKLIEEQGLKGLRVGDAEVSPMHANFIVNRGNAASRDILALILAVRSKVQEASGHLLDCEVRFMRADGAIIPAHAQGMPA